MTGGNLLSLAKSLTLIPMAASLKAVGFSEIRDDFKFGGLFGVAEEDGSGEWDSKEDANAWKMADTFWSGWGADIPSCVALSIAFA